MHEQELVQARESAVPTFVGRGDEAFFRRDAREPLPRFVDLDPIDAVAPGVERNVSGFVESMPARELRERTGCARSHRR